VAILADQVSRLGAASTGGPTAGAHPPGAARMRGAASTDAMGDRDIVAAVELPPPPPSTEGSAPPLEPTPDNLLGWETPPPSQRSREATPESPIAPPNADPDQETFAQRSSRLVASVVTLAELAAVEIRASAEIEAAAIRSQASAHRAAPTTSHLLVLLERQRQMLAALSLQTDRLEQAGAVLRAQILALEAEREHIVALISPPAQ